MPDTSVSRREFALGLAALPALALAAPVEQPAAAATEKQQPDNAPADKAAEQSNKQPPENDPPEEPEIPEAAWLLGLILKRYPDERLDETAIRGILGDIQSDLRRSKTLSDFPLDNADEPCIVFRPFVGE